MAVSEHLLRLTAPNYLDGISAMRPGADPVAVSQIVFDQAGDMPNALGASDLFVTWGQFIDHDLSLTRDASGEFVTVPGLVAPMQRSVFDTDAPGPRQQINEVTVAMDGSQIYGSDGTREAMLRTFDGGRLRLDDQGMMPLATDAGSMAGTDPDDPLFLAGDIRANENTGLTTLHTLFAREHNYWADRIAADHPDWDDQQIFAAARSVVEAELQKITYKDWLPGLIGDAVGDTGHDPAADGRISTEFSTAAFRFGHTMVSSLVERIEENGATSEMGHITVMEAFFNNDPMKQDGIDAILRGQAGSMAQMSDAKMIDDLNMFLATPDGTSGFSLAALNILRGQDHGLNSYVEIRAALLGDIDPARLDPTDFSVITSNPETAAALATAFGVVGAVDVWTGGLSEDHIPGTQMGALFTHIIADQFTRSAAADAGFGQIDPALSDAITAEIAGTSLADIITRNSDVEHLQQDVFTAANRIGGDDGRDRLTGTGGDDLILGFGGNDRISARSGDDTVFGGSGRDMIRGNRGDDALFGEAGRDSLYGGRGADMLEGGAGRDRLFGGRDNDRLDGGTGNDVLTGGRGADVFVFAEGGGDDRITDFRAGDVIELSGFGITDFDSLTAHISRQGCHTRIEIGDDSMTLVRVKPWHLEADDFDFG